MTLWTNPLRNVSPSSMITNHRGMWVMHTRLMRELEPALMLKGRENQVISFGCLTWLHLSICVERHSPVGTFQYDFPSLSSDLLSVTLTWSTGPICSTHQVVVYPAAHVAKAPYYTSTIEASFNPIRNRCSSAMGLITQNDFHTTQVTTHATRRVTRCKG